MLYEALIDTLAAQGFTQAIAAISLPNDASIKLHEALGFFRAGVYREIGFKHGAWRDVGLWQRELATAEVPPPETRSFQEAGVVRLDCRQSGGGRQGSRVRERAGKGKRV